MDRKQIRIDRIAERIFESRLRTARFKINKERVYINEEGLYAELDGTFDDYGIEKALKMTSSNLLTEAKDFAELLNNSKNGNIRETIQEKIKADDFRPVYDEYSGRIFLFLPRERYEKHSKSKKTDDEKMQEVVERLKHISGTLENIIEGDLPSYNPIELNNGDDRFIAIPLNIQENFNYSGDAGDPLSFRLTFYKKVNKRNEHFDLAARMMVVTQDNEIILDKSHGYTFPLVKEYNLPECAIDKQYLLFSLKGFSNQATKHAKENAKRLGTDIHKYKNEILGKFIKDIEEFTKEHTK